METSVAGVTVKPVDPLMLPEVAVTVAEPGATAVANPAVTVATEAADELQVAELVKFCVVPSL
jgi:hypothetical protein